MCISFFKKEVNNYLRLLRWIGTHGRKSGEKIVYVSCSEIFHVHLRKIGIEISRHVVVVPEIVFGVRRRKG